MKAEKWRKDGVEVKKNRKRGKWKGIDIYLDGKEVFTFGTWFSPTTHTFALSTKKAETLYAKLGKVLGYEK